MKPFRLFLIAALLLFVALPLRAQTGSISSNSRWNVYLNLTFPGTSLNASQFNTAYPYGDYFGAVHGTEQEFHADSQVQVGGGTLNLEERPGINPAGLPYISGMVTTYKKVAFWPIARCVEVRASLPITAGVHPCALWMKPADGSVGTTIDMAESDGDGHISFNVQALNKSGAWVTASSIGYKFPAGQSCADLHDYMVDIETWGLTYYVDGKQVGFVAPSSAWPNIVPHCDLYFLSTLDINQAPFPLPNATTKWPQVQQLQWIKVASPK